jgi:Flp pilus assembly protein TadD
LSGVRLIVEQKIKPRLEAARHAFSIGAFVDAETGFRDVTSADRGCGEAWNMLGITLLRLGKVDEAIQALTTAMDVAPRSPEVVVNLGNLYKEVGNLKKAVRYYRKALALSPDHINAHVNLALCLVDDGAPDLARAHAQEAVTINGSDVSAWDALASIEERAGNYEKAIAILEKCEEILPDHPDVLLHLGCACSLAKRYDLAEVKLRRALQLRPGFVEAMATLSHVYFESGNLDAAEDCLIEALHLRPEMRELYINLANVRLGQCRNEEGIECFKRALSMKPDSASTHFVLGMAYLVTGDFANGWKEYVWRWKTEKYSPKLTFLAAPEWQGEPLAGKTLFVHAEQGIGDTLQFVRYLSMLQEQGCKIVLEVQPLLKRLISRLKGIDALIECGEPLPSMDFHVPLLNIPGIIGTDICNIPRDVPYLSVDVGARDVWQKRLDTLPPGLNVGIVWAGSPTHDNDRNRSMRLSQFAPFAKLDGINWISLQKGGAGAQVNSASQQLVTIDWTTDIHDFEDSAALIECLDLVISVDTSAVHLAGALNKPVWAMIPFAPDWRWLLDRTDSPWYPSLRLFRQKHRGNWDTVIAEVVQALKELTYFNKSTLT